MVERRSKQHQEQARAASDIRSLRVTDHNGEHDAGQCRSIENQAQRALLRMGRMRAIQARANGSSGPTWTFAIPT